MSMPSTPPGPPSYWSGHAASAIPFEDPADYSRWACLLLAQGHEGDGIAALAGMEGESNLFVLREWHRRALADLGVTPPGPAEAFSAHLRGRMEEFLQGRWCVIELLQELRDLSLDTPDPRLQPFVDLHGAWWDSEDADWGVRRDDIPHRLRQACEAFIAMHEAELVVASHRPLSSRGIPQGMAPIVRRLEAGEAGLYRSVRLESLRESPEAFATTYESALARDDESWRAQADGSAAGSDRATFVVLAGRPVGVAALYRDPDRPDEGELIQVWVAPERRGGRVAADLMTAIYDWAAANGFETIRAEVTAANTRALRFYEKHGFVPVEDPAAAGVSVHRLMRRVGSGAPAGNGG